MTIVLSGLRVLIGGTPLVDGVDLTLAPGTRTALVGASGAGKSLTTAALAGTVTPAATLEGSLTLVAEGAEGTEGTEGAENTGATQQASRSRKPAATDGAATNLLGTPAARRPATARVALVQQDPSTALHPLVPVATQVAHAARAAGASRAQARAEATTLLGRVGLGEELGARVPARLSGGQRQRAAIALALASRPVLVIADEPTAALDVVARAELLAVLQEVTAPTTGQAGTAPALLLVTHDLPAAALCDQVVVLDAGHVIERGPAHQVITAPTHPTTRAMCAAAREESLAGALAAIEARGAVEDCALCEVTGQEPEESREEHRDAALA